MITVTDLNRRFLHRRMLFFLRMGTLWKANGHLLAEPLECPQTEPSQKFRFESLRERSDLQSAGYEVPCAPKIDPVAASTLGSATGDGARFKCSNGLSHWTMSRTKRCTLGETLDVNYEAGGGSVY